jgi:hypothetical protein
VTAWSTANLLRNGLIQNLGSGVITTLFRKGLTANLFKKSLIEDSVTFGFESLIPKPYRRDQPAKTPSLLKTLTL